MIKPEWGTKRTCNSCGAKFYDLRRDPIICPKCDAKLDLAVASRSQRTKASAAVVKKTPKKVVAAPVEEATDDPKVVSEDVLDIADDDEEDDDSPAIEDVSELGEDDDDILGVKVADAGEETV